MIELLACPFCGSTDLEGPNCTEYIGDRRHPVWWLSCNDCPADMQADGETPDALIAAWNRRQTK